MEVNPDQIKNHINKTNMYMLSQADIELLYNSLCETLKTRLTETQKAIKSKNHASLARAAHSLKGTTNTLGLFQQANLVEHIEIEATSEELISADKKFQQLIESLSPLFS